MDVNRWLRAIAGFFVLLSVALGHFVHPYWYFFTAFVGLNLLQSAFTRWCPMMSFLRRLGSEGDAMQMLMIVVESSHKERVEAALTEHRVLGYTEIPTVHGTGKSGMRLGSRAFPETSSIIFTVIENEKVDELLAAIDSSCSDCRQFMRMIVWGVERMV